MSVKILRSLSLIALLAASLGQSAEISAVRATDEAAAVEWLKASAHQFSSESPSTDEMQLLVNALRHAQVVGIGEVTHGSHEDQSFRAELIKALVQQKQIAVLLLESNRQIGVDLDAYVMGRGGDLPLLLRSPGFFRTWRDEEFADLILWLRAYNIQAEQPVRIVGIDCQDSGVDARYALRFVYARDRLTAKRLAQAFSSLSAAKDPRFSAYIASASTADYRKAMNASVVLEKLFITHQTVWENLPGFAEAAYAAKTAREGFNAFELDGGRGDPRKDEMEYYGRRDRFMSENLLARLQQRTGAFWAHDMHVMADLPASDNWPAGYTWVGRLLRAQLGLCYETVTFAWSRGAFRAQTKSKDDAYEVLHRTPLVPQILPNDGPADLGGVLLQTGMARFWADLRTLPQEPWAPRFTSTPYPRGWAGWRVDPQTWNKDEGDLASLRPATDILVWFKTITPSHMLPGHDF